MHIPDGMLSNGVALASGAAGAGSVAFAVGWVKRHVRDSRTVLMAVLAALVFALQMLNFPIAPGISGHFSGGAAVAILIGVWPAVIVMSTVVFVQALMFADGGIVALGANIINLGVVAPSVGYAAWRLLAGDAGSPRRERFAAFASGWSAVVAAALAVAVEVWLSGRVGLLPAAVALGGWHAIIGLGEGVITAGLMSYVASIRPDVLSRARRGGRRSIAWGLGLVAVIAAALSWAASSRPDALEFVSISGGFAGVEPQGLSPLAGYSVAGIADERLAGVVAAFVGIVVTGLLLWAVALSMRGRKKSSHAPEFHRHGHVHDTDPEHEHPHHHVEDQHEHPHASSYERYTYIISPVHSLNPKAKIVGAFILILAVVLTPPMRPVEVVAIAALLGAVGLLARLPLLAIAKRSLVVLPIALTMALYAPLTEGGWLLAWSILTRAWLSALTVLLLAATTRASALVAGLRRLGMPLVYATTLTFLHRYTSVLVAQVVSTRRAVLSRAASASAARLVPTYGNLAGSLVLRSYERGERIHAAMLSRGFTGDLPADTPPSWGLADLLTVLLALLAASALFFY